PNLPTCRRRFVAGLWGAGVVARETAAQATKETPATLRRPAQDRATAQDRSKVGCAGMPRFVQPDLATTWKSKRPESPSAGFGDGRKPDALSGQLGYRRVQVVAHQIQLVPRGTVDGMYGDLRRRELEDQPSCSGVDAGAFEDVAEEDAICFGVAAVNDHVATVDHTASVTGPPALTVTMRRHARRANTVGWVPLTYCCSHEDSAVAGALP